MSKFGYTFDAEYDSTNMDQFQNQSYGYNDTYNNAIADYGEPGGNPSYGDYGYEESDHDPNEESEFAMGDDAGGSVSDAMEDVDFDDPRIANLPRILLMGPRRAGKTSIQVRFGRDYT